MKATQEQLITLLKTAGLPDVEVVESEADSDFSLDNGLKAIDDTRGKIMRPTIEEELKTELTKSIDGRRGGELRNYLIKTTGISRAQIEKIDKDQDAIKAAYDFVTANLQGDAMETKKKIDELIAAHNSEKEALANQHTEALNAERNIRIERDALDYIEANVLKDIPFPEGADRKVLARDYYNHLKGEFHTVYDETGKALNLFDKTKPTFPAMKGNVPISLTDNSKEFFSVRGLVKKDMRDINPLEKLKQLTTDPYKPNPIPQQDAGTGAIEKAKQARQEVYKQSGLV